MSYQVAVIASCVNAVQERYGLILFIHFVDYYIVVDYEFAAFVLTALILTNWAGKWELFQVFD